MWRTLQLLKLFVSFCFFRNQPADIPLADAPALFKENLKIYVAVWLVTLVTLEDPVAAVLQTAIGLIATVSHVWALLAIKQRLDLFLQTATAVMGVQSLIVTISLPWLLWVHVADYEDILLPFYTTVALSLWLLAVIADLLRKSLATSKTSSPLLAMGYFSAVLGSAIALFA